MAKTVPLSVRVSHEDAEFIANLYIGDAVTPSDKVRGYGPGLSWRSIATG
jgi:hypothetical protein